MRLILISTLVFILGLSIWFVKGYFFGVKDLLPIWDESRIIRYSFEIQNKDNTLVKNAKFRTFAPVLITSSQKVVDIKSTHDFKIETDEFDNQLMHFDLPDMPPFSTVTLSVTVEMLLSSVVAQPLVDKKLYHSDQPLIETSNKNVMNLSRQFEARSMSTFEKSQGIFDWLKGNVEYSGYNSVDKGAAFAAVNLTGDCTEYAYLNTAIARNLGIPSRAVNGYVVEANSKLKVSEYHTWSELWFDQGWQVVDAQKGNFLSNQENYIAMSIYTRDDMGKNEFNLNRFSISNKDLKVVMK